MLSHLAFCAPRVSCVIAAEISEVWETFGKDWGRQPWMQQLDGQAVHFRLVEGVATAVGAVRCVRLGHAQMFEKLVALDDEEHMLKWRLISHPDSVSPFPEASYVNFFTAVSMKEVTHGKQTFVEWKGEFFTERHFAQEMHSMFERWFHSGLIELQAYMTRQQMIPGFTQQAASGHVMQPARSSPPFPGGSQPGPSIPMQPLHSAPGMGSSRYPLGGMPVGSMPVGSMPIHQGMGASHSHMQAPRYAANMPGRSVGASSSPGGAQIPGVPDLEAWAQYPGTWRQS